MDILAVHKTRQVIITPYLYAWLAAIADIKDKTAPQDIIDLIQDGRFDCMARLNFGLPEVYLDITNAIPVLARLYISANVIERFKGSVTPVNGNPEPYSLYPGAIEYLVHTSEDYLPVLQNLLPDFVKLDDNLVDITGGFY